MGRCKVTLVAFVWLFPTVHDQMSPQIACLWWCIVTLAAFVCFFLAMCFQMFSQVACLRGCIITLAASIWLFSTVHVQMCLQMMCIRGCKVTLVAFVWLFSTVYFEMLPQTACRGLSIFTLVAFVCHLDNIKVIFAMMNVHHFHRFDVSPFEAPVKLTQKRGRKNNQKHHKIFAVLCKIIPIWSNLYTDRILPAL